MTYRPWSKDRKAELPPDWPRIRQRILQRDDHRCTWIFDDYRCPATATDVDHIRPGGDHSDGNLRSLCHDHHQAKSSAEGHAARARYPMRRPTEKHPGIL